MELVEIIRDYIGKFKNLTSYFKRRTFYKLGYLTLYLSALACNGKNTSNISPIHPDNPVSPALTVIYPNGGEMLELGSHYDARWASRDVPPDVSISIKLVDSNELETIVATSLNDGIERFTVPRSLREGLHKLKVGTTLDTKVMSDQSDNSFRIISPAPLIVPPAEIIETIIAVGDIGWDNSGGVISRAKEVGTLVDGIPGRLLTLGDHAYPNGTYEEFLRYYDPFFGRHKARTYPSLGNHDVVTPGAAGYFQYFGSRAPSNYYSFNLGAWHIIALDSNVNAFQIQLQAQWLSSDLESNKRDCTLAFDHHPLFSSGQNGDNPHIRILWQLLYENNADVFLSAHDHVYERFAPQDPNGRFDPIRGIRKFIVGTGGARLYRFVTFKPNSEVRENQTYGVLRMTLRQKDYDWEFVPIAGQSFRDLGRSQCH